MRFRVADSDILKALRRAAKGDADWRDKKNGTAFEALRILSLVGPELELTELGVVVYGALVIEEAKENNPHMLRDAWHMIDWIERRRAEAHRNDQEVAERQKTWPAGHLMSKEVPSA